MAGSSRPNQVARQHTALTKSKDTGARNNQFETVAVGLCLRPSAALDSLSVTPWMGAEGSTLELACLDFD